MTPVVPLLERLACTPYDDAAFAGAVAALEPALRDALLGGRSADLVHALGARPVMACMVATPDRDSPQPDDAPAEDVPDDSDAGPAGA